jgi:ferredoxin-NADP reductase
VNEPKGTVKARLLHSREVAPETRHFTFQLPADQSFQFQPGQFISLFYPLEEKWLTRAYSLAGQEQADQFEICLNHVSDGKFSPVLFRMQPGEELDCKGPYGTFVWRNQEREAILVATGTGITPYRTMLAERLAQDSERQYTLVFGVRRPENLIYRDEWENLADKHPNFRFWPTLSRADETWAGRRGYVQRHVLEALGDRRDIDVYICGMKAMVDDLREQLKNLGLDRKQVIYEKYD